MNEQLFATERAVDPLVQAMLDAGPRVVVTPVKALRSRCGW